MPPAAVSIGRPGMEIGAPGRPGLASSNSSRTMTFEEGSGADSATSLTSAEKTITRWATAATCSKRSVRFVSPAFKANWCEVEANPMASTRTV